jgi:hypothetical protein
MEEMLAIGLQFGTRLCAVGRSSTDRRVFDYDVVDIGGSPAFGNQIRQVCYQPADRDRANAGLGESIIRRMRNIDHFIASPRDLLLQRGSRAPGVGGRAAECPMQEALTMVLEKAISATPHARVAAYWLAVPDVLAPQQFDWLLRAAQVKVADQQLSATAVPESVAACIGLRGLELPDVPETVLICDWGWSTVRLTLMRIGVGDADRRPTVEVLAHAPVPGTGGALLEDGLLTCWLGHAEFSSMATLERREDDALQGFALDAGTEQQIALNIPEKAFLQRLLDAQICVVEAHTQRLLAQHGLTYADLGQQYAVGGYSRAVEERRKEKTGASTWHHDGRTAVARGATALAACEAGFFEQQGWKIIPLHGGSR